MAPTKVKTSSSKSENRRSSKPSASGSSSKIKKAKASKPVAKTVQQKTKSTKLGQKKKKVYTAEQLGIPELNGIRPTGVQKAPNMKKGKVFTDDGEGMKAIMAMVMAEKEGNIESKLIKARHLEELREARKAEAEKRAASKKEGLEERKQDIKGGKKRRQTTDGAATPDAAPEKVAKKTKKRVSFG